MSQSPLARMSMSRLHEMLEDLKPELKEATDGDLYVSVPTAGFYEALEVETYETPRTLFFTLHRRAWDRTGGMSKDDELGESHELYLIEAMLKAEIEHQRQVNESMEQYERNSTTA